MHGGLELQRMVSPQNCFLEALNVATPLRRDCGSETLHQGLRGLETIAQARLWKHERRMFERTNGESPDTDVAKASAWCFHPSFLRRHMLDAPNTGPSGQSSEKQ